MPYRVIEMIQIGPFHVRTWGLLVGIGLVVGFLVASWAARKRGIPSDKFYNRMMRGQPRLVDRTTSNGSPMLASLSSPRHRPRSRCPSWPHLLRPKKHP